jgi:lipopolysaccharide export system permease protein
MNGYDVEIQKKFALAVACIVFVLLGAPIALRFPRGGVGLTIAVSLGVFALYYVCLIAGEELANRGYVRPFWAMWAANILFTGIGLVLMARMGREGATARGGDVGEALEQLRIWFARQARRVGIRAERRAHAT